MEINKLHFGKFPQPGQSAQSCQFYLKNVELGVRYFPIEYMAPRPGSA